MTASPDQSSPIRRRLICNGAVQGVGFRPTVYRLAQEHRLGGFIRNSPAGVVIELEGSPADVEAFISALPESLPPLAQLAGMQQEEVLPLAETEFRVEITTPGALAGALAPPDAAVCPDCRREMNDPADRRYHYPFTTCTNCGPRYSLIRSLPYDREQTSMACFPLCPECETEYTNPADRRFHTEPVCCPHCGPRLWLTDSRGHELGEGEGAIDLARQLLIEGKILALKGLGGFQLSCRADSPDAISRLRQRKRRPAKPLAIMVHDLSVAQRLLHLSEEGLALLQSAQSPILLARRKAECDLPQELAPGLDDLGVMLPTTPLHLELLRELSVDTLVMTSGNSSDEPICKGNREALAKLAHIADAFLLHDRDVVRRVDDSVCRATDQDPFVIRRSRGYVPSPLPLPAELQEPAVAMGAYLQNTICLGQKGSAYISQHIGDLDTVESRGFQEEAIGWLSEFLEIDPTLFVVDLHPDYPGSWLGRRLSEERSAELLPVQHHLAHLAAAAAEHALFPAGDEVVHGLILDGTGLGTDGTAWGGEWLTLRGDLTWSRSAWLEPLPLTGGEQAVREPWRVLCAALDKAGAADLYRELPLSENVSQQEWDRVRQLSRNDNWPLASGAGRVFEAAGALLNLTTRNRWEGEAAARLEALAAGWQGEKGALKPWPEVVNGDGLQSDRLISSELLKQAVLRLIAGEEPAAVAVGIHISFAALAAELTRRIWENSPGLLVLGGGCLVNRILRSELQQRLQQYGFTVALPQRVPPGDGGIAYGQLALAAAASAAGLKPKQTEE